MTPEPAPDVSIVVPLHDEEGNIRPLCAELREVLADWDRSWELILVDDGSTDGTLARLREEHAADRRVRVLVLSSNFGQTEALVTGFAVARGSVIVTMDGDLQSDPRDIPRLVERLEQGHDLVCGWRQDRKDDRLPRVLPSRVANWLIGKLTGVPVHDNGCTLKAWRAELVRVLHLYADMHRFLPAISTMAGARVTELPVTHRPRIHGSSKYGLSRVFKVLADLFTIKMLIQFANRPGLWFFALAFPWMGLTLLALTGWMIQHWVGDGLPTIVMPSLAVVCVYLVGHLFSLVLFSEFYVAHADRAPMRRLVECLSERIEPEAE